MASVQHAALDGSPVTIEADADLSAPMTAFGFVRPRGWQRSHPFNIYKAGESERLLATIPQRFPEVDFTVLDDVELNGGTLRRALVRWPEQAGGMRRLAFGCWEGSVSSLTTSITKGSAEDIRDLFHQVRFHETPHGVGFTSPVDESVRPLRCLKEVGTTLLEIQPRSPEVSRSLPRRAGRRVAGGEVFRRNAKSRDVLLLTDTAAVFVSPLRADDDHLRLATALTVAWGA